MCIKEVLKPVVGIGKKAAEPILDTITAPYRPAPTPTPTPTPAPAEPKLPEPEAATAKATEAVNRNSPEQAQTRRSRALRSTVLTSALGLTEPANLRRKTLLGQ